MQLPNEEPNGESKTKRARLEAKDTEVVKWKASTPRSIQLGVGRHPRGRLGFVMLSQEYVADDDIRSIIPWDVGVFFTRIKLKSPINIENLLATGDTLTDVASLLPPDMNAICYVCTAAGVALGEDKVAKLLANAQPKAKTCSTISCVMDAMRALNMSRFVVGTPYLDEVNHSEADFLMERGFNVLDIQGLCISDGCDMNLVEPSDIVKLALSIDRPDADGIFISCTSLRTVEVVEEIEKRTGKPCVCSNQAVIWRMMRLVGVNDRIEGYGRLLREH